MATAAARRAYDGPALFSFGFRPFFLFAAAWAALAVPAWVLGMRGLAPFEGLGRDWHVHEMIFGYLAGVVAGFLLTAVPNWTGRLPVMGGPLATLVGLWSAGRAAMLFQAELGPLAAAIDSLFLTAFAAVVWLEVLSGRNWRNAPVCGLVTLLAAANIAFHLRAMWPDAGPAAERAAIGAAAVLIALIGGRIVPSFTRNWLMQRGVKSAPAPWPWLDKAGPVLVGLGAVGWAVAPEQPATGLLLSAAGAATLVRLARWQGLRARREPLVWILHAGYAWLGAGLVVLGLAALFPDAVPRTAGVHALTAGAVGVMTLAVMTRASLGHTGRALTANRATLAIYLAILASAGLRVLAPFSPTAQVELLAASAVLWSAAFGGFVLAYAPLLLRPRPAVQGR